MKYKLELWDGVSDKHWDLLFDTERGAKAAASDFAAEQSQLGHDWETRMGKISEQDAFEWWQDDMWDNNDEWQRDDFKVVEEEDFE